MLLFLLESYKSTNNTGLKGLKMKKKHFCTQSLWGLFWAGTHPFSFQF